MLKVKSGGPKIGFSNTKIEMFDYPFFDFMDFLIWWPDAITKMFSTSWARLVPPVWGFCALGSSTYQRPCRVVVTCGLQMHR